MSESNESDIHAYVTNVDNRAGSEYYLHHASKLDLMGSRMGLNLSSRHITRLLTKNLMFGKSGIWLFCPSRPEFVVLRLWVCSSQSCLHPCSFNILRSRSRPSRYS